MNIAVRAAPPPGSAQAGDLYVDLQSRTLWLGVDPVVDPAAFVLISDIVALQSEIATGDDLVTAYVDSQITTRAPTVHTHTSVQITDFTSAVTAVATAIPGLQFTRGMVMMYSGSLAEIGVGALAGWTLCDGSNGSPDLRERFILAAGNRAVGSKNASNSMDTAAAGGHDHLLGSTAITAAQMPYHGHGGATSNETVNHQHYVSGYTSAGGDHAHGGVADVGPTKIASGTWGSYGAVGGGTDGAGNHQHTVNFWSGTVSAYHQHYVTAEGGNQGHTHTTSGDGTHSHNITGAQLREAVPFYALAFIMKT